MTLTQITRGKIGDREQENRTRDLKWKAGICGICPAGCWVQVGLKDGRLVDIQQDTGHPWGMICRRGQHAPGIVNSEHRLKFPMKRVGSKGTPELERITWDQAFDIIVERLNQNKRES